MHWPGGPSALASAISFLTAMLLYSGPVIGQASDEELLVRGSDFAWRASQALMFDDINGAIGLYGVAHEVCRQRSSGDCNGADHSATLDRLHALNEVIERATFAAQSGNWDLTVSLYQEALQNREGLHLPLVMYNLALAYDRSGGRELHAILWYNQYLGGVRNVTEEVRDHHSARIQAVWRRLAEVHADLDRAVDELVQIVQDILIERNYDDRAGWTSLAKVYAAQGNFHDAMSAIERAVTSAEQYRSRMNRLRAPTAYFWYSYTPRDVLVSIAVEQIKRGEIASALRTAAGRVPDATSVRGGRLPLEMIVAILENDVDRAWSIGQEISQIDPFEGLRIFRDAGDFNVLAGRDFTNYDRGLRTDLSRLRECQWSLTSFRASPFGLQGCSRADSYQFALRTSNDYRFGGRFWDSVLSEGLLEPFDDDWRLIARNQERADANATIANICSLAQGLAEMRFMLLQHQRDPGV